MKVATVDGKPTPAASDSPDEALCPSCGGVVHKRKRRRMDGHITYFYRHKRGEGTECPLRYHP